MNCCDTYRKGAKSGDKMEIVVVGSCEIRIKNKMEIHYSIPGKRNP
jgi:hypothetical protein